jgi:hypothetical protein
MEDTNIQVIQMTSGTLVISEVVGSTKSEMILRYPLEMNFTYEESGATRLYLQRWMPYSENNEVTINAGTIESKTICSTKYREMYGVRIAHFKELVQSALEYMSGEQDSENEHDEDESDGYEPESHSETKTLH